MNKTTITNPTKKISTFKCPICLVPMIVFEGSKMNAKDGITVWCETPHGQEPGQCSAQEVFGHAKNEKEACEIVTNKYKKD